MKVQWSIIFSLIFALIIAIFAVVNVDPVPINYIFGTAEVPLILVILGSALFGGLAVGIIGIVLQYRLRRKVRSLERSLNNAETEGKTSNDSALPVQAEKEDEAVQEAEKKDHTEIN